MLGLSPFLSMLFAAAKIPASAARSSASATLSFRRIALADLTLQHNTSYCGNRRVVATHATHQNSVTRCNGARFHATFWSMHTVHGKSITSHVLRSPGEERTCMDCRWKRNCDMSVNMSRSCHTDGPENNTCQNFIPVLNREHAVHNKHVI